MRIALTRPVSPAITHCELTHLARQPIDLPIAENQHAAYEQALSELGCVVERLPSAPDLADSVFIEDTAVVLDELAVITRPGAASRRAETQAVAEHLRAYRRLYFLSAPATLDGGDVLVLDKTVFIGLSQRTSLAGVEQMENILHPYGYTVRGIVVQGCLHLKSAVTQVSQRSLLINPQWVDPRVFQGWEVLLIDPGEPYAANALMVDEAVIYPTSYPRTHQRIEAAGIQVRGVEVSELIKAEGAVTCCSLVFKQDTHSH